MKLKYFGIAVLAVLLVGCASSPYSGPNGKSIVVSKEVWGFYQEYVAKISGVYRGVFVVGLQDGYAVTGSANYCPGASCYTTNFGKGAFDSCRSFGYDLECVMFASSAEIQVNYTIEGE